MYGIKSRRARELSLKKTAMQDSASQNSCLKNIRTVMSASFGSVRCHSSHTELFTEWSTESTCCNKGDICRN